ncbi:MAG: hypothetical protein ACI9MC_001324 [Kiritimatiellia bacterium]|jgi:hypothetical protein
MFENVGSRQDDDAAVRAAIASLIVALLTSTFTCIGLLTSSLVWSQMPHEQISVVDLGWEDLVEREQELGILPPPAARLGGPQTVAETPADNPVLDIVLDDPKAPEILDTTVRSVLAIAGRGVPDGVPEGNRDGVPNGLLCGAPDRPCGPVTSLSSGGGVVRLHHTQVRVRRKVQPLFPGEAVDEGIESARCVARVTIDVRGRPERIAMTECPEVFHASARAALRGWRWYPARDGLKNPVRAKFSIHINYRLK